MTVSLPKSTFLFNPRGWSFSRSFLGCCWPYASSVTGKLRYRTRSTHQCIYCRKQWESTQKKPSHFLQFLKLTIFWRALKYWHGSLTEASSPFFPFFPVDVATKTERELWWEHCQGAKDDGSHGKGQRSWHQSQVSILPFTITAVRGTREHHPKWVHLHVETNSKDAAKKARNCQSSNFIGKALDLTTNKPIFPQQLTDRVPINLFLCISDQNVLQDQF